MNAVIQKYGVAIFSFIIAVLTAVQVMNHWGLVDILQLAVIVVTSFTAYGLSLLPRGWQGAAKTGADILGAALMLILPFAIQGHITGPQIVLVIIGVVKAAATELGVQIRTDPAIVAPVVPSLPGYPFGTSADAQVAADPTSVAEPRDQQGRFVKASAPTSPNTKGDL